MENREFRNELHKLWIGNFAKAKPEPQIVTPKDVIKLTAKFAAGCALAMGVVVLAMMVAL